jgi:ABC-2 type transport system permease protein
MALAGTDARHHRHFADAAEHYRRQMVAAMNMAVMRNEGEVDDGYIGTQALNRMVGREIWETVPPFVYQSPSLDWALAYGGRPSAVLTIWLCGAILAVGAAIGRLPVDPA